MKLVEPGYSEKWFWKQIRLLNRLRAYKPAVMQRSSVGAGGPLLVSQGRETQAAYLPDKAACCPFVTTVLVGSLPQPDEWRLCLYPISKTPS